MAQTVFKLKLSENVTVNFETNPNFMEKSVDKRNETYQIRCPEGTMISDNPGDLRNNMIPGTGCAYACRSLIYHKDELREIDFIVEICPAIAFPFIMAVLLTWVFDAEKGKKGYSILINAIFPGTFNFFVFILGNCETKDGWRFHQSVLF
jgi:hypothetical protein